LDDAWSLAEARKKRQVVIANIGGMVTIATAQFFLHSD